MSPSPGVRVVEDASELAHQAAELVLEQAREAIAARGAFHLALAGGSTPRAAYAELANAEADFARWHAWFGDERCVPPEDVQSNYRMVRESGLLARLHPSQVHRLRGEAPDAEHEAERYARELCDSLGVPPRLDLVLLGLGADGHTASLFPRTPTLEDPGWVAVGRAPAPPHARLTLTLRTLAEARTVAFLVAGADKREALARCLEPSSRSEAPARRVRPRTGSLLWLVERSAAPSEAL
jgi:6-phosphogluconolactonase